MGRRTLAIDRESGQMRERLRLRPELKAFARVLHERLPLIAGLEDERFARPRAIETEADGRLSVLTDYVGGRRLSDAIEDAAQQEIVAGLDAGLGLLLELLPALSRLHDAGIVHGALGPGRVMFTPAGQIVLTDAIYAEALERLQLTRKRLWTELGLAFPSTAGSARFDRGADLTQAALTAAALIVGRPLREDEYPEGLTALHQEIVEIASIRASKAFADGVDAFFSATLPLPNRKTVLASADEAAIDLRKVLRKEVGIAPCRTAMLEFFQQVDAAERDRAALSAMELANIEAQRLEVARFEADVRAKARDEAERSAREEAEQQARDEAERQAREDSERRAREEAERQARDDAERRERERLEAEQRARDEEERRVRDEAERRAREEAERQAREEAERRERERLEAEQRAREEEERRAREEAERRAREEAERKAREEAERIERERLEAERRARDEEERRAREEAERKAREEAERRAREEAERRAREEAERRERERLEAERRAREEEERRAREEAERKAREEAERRERERLEAERRAREEEERRAREEAERRAREEAERKAREEAERRERERLEAERRAREEEERRAREEAERKAREEAERLAREEAERLERERAEQEARERIERASIEAERLERERIEVERRERERAEQEMRERIERARVEAERAERERIERLERERIEREQSDRERIEAARLEAQRRERERLDAERQERERVQQEARDRERAEQEARERDRLDQQARERDARDREARERQRAEQDAREQERLEREREEHDRLAQEARERERLEHEARERERAEQDAREEERLEREREEHERAAAAAAAAAAAQQPVQSGWLVHPDRAAAFEPAVVEPTVPSQAAASPYPIYLPPAETESWTPGIEAPSPIEIAPVAGSSSSSAASAPASGSSPIRLQGQSTPAIRLKGDSGTHLQVPTRASSRHEPEQLSAAGAYEPFGTVKEPQPVPWKLLAAGVILIAGTFAATKGLLPSEIPTPKLGRAILPQNKPAAPQTPVTAVTNTGGPTGRITVNTDPAGIRVLLDGKAVGASPLVIDKVAPGKHVLTMQGAGGLLKRNIKIAAGETFAIEIPVFSGFAEIAAPIVLDISEDGKSIGTTENQIILGPGRHVLTLQNRDLNYTGTQTVDIEPGEIKRLQVDPRGSANINAVPWAEVFIDGEKVGETPLANVQIRLGVREIVLKNPQFPERKIVTTIKSGTTPNVTVDFTKDR